MPPRTKTSANGKKRGCAFENPEPFLFSKGYWYWSNELRPRNEETTRN